LVVLTATSWLATSTAARTPDTFVIKIVLPVPTIHIGAVLVIEETLSNSTDHVVVAGSGFGVGSMVECLNERGEDLGQRAMGRTALKIPDADTPTLRVDGGKALRTGTIVKTVWRYTPSPGSLVSGTYRLAHPHPRHEI